jgi:hypothetical protein
MAITNLSDVTETLKTLVTVGLQLQSEQDAFTVTAASPDSNFGNDNAVSVHLFHAIESPEFKNLPPSFGTGPVPVRLAPLGLILQYVISVFTRTDDESLLDTGAKRQQRFLGYIARVIHDYPIISTSTSISIPGSTVPVPILQGTLVAANAKLAFNLRPAPKEEAISFWSSQEQHVPRFSLFVEGRVAVLEAQPPPVAPGIVLSVGQFIFPASTPQLFTTSSNVWFEPPSGPARMVLASPARVAMFDAPNSAALQELVPPALPPGDPARNILQNNVLTIDATGLSPPGQRFLVLRSSVKSFSAKLSLDLAPADQPPPNGDWNLSATDSSVTASVFQNVFDVDSATTKAVLPGIYGARVIVNDLRAGPTPRPRATNELAFPITPQILTAAPASPAASRTYAVRLVGKYLNSSLDIQLSVGGLVLHEINTGTPTDNQFFVPLIPPNGSTANDTDQLVLVLPVNDPNTGKPLVPPSNTNPVPVQLVINGATATPAWITVEAP